MATLEKTLRNQLERTVKDAREEAEMAAKASLEQIGVGDAAPPDHLCEQERELRRKLRTHGRQLGDHADEKKKTQQLDRLIEEVAYEHWHRMLFARFLSENELLMYPDPREPVAISLEECDDLAPEEGARNGWELAARYAARMLPQIFRPDSPVFQLNLPPENQQALERMVAELPADVFHASDSLGWVYQFWQSKKKDEVNASEVKIGAREISAVTQLFTEPYMVSFLLDNSLGAWWAGQRLSSETLRKATSEAELRKQASLPGVPLEYLRFAALEDDGWSITAGTFNAWPKRFDELKVLDPCCGSGHFLVASFLMLVPMRMAAENLSAREAVDAVLRENIHGLEIDHRCVELAVFALALAAWTYPSAGGYRPLPTLNVACTGLSISSSLERWMAILEGQSLKMDLRFYFEQLYDLFNKAPTLGSLINPHRFLGSGLLDDRGMKMLFETLRNAVKHEPSASERYELGVVAEGLAKASELLAERYTLVVTNVPYLGRGKQDDILREHIEKHYPLGKADLATAFVLRCLEFCAQGGTEALVTPQNWLFLTTYTKLRTLLLEKRQWNIVARLGPSAFETISGHVVNVALPMITASPPEKDNLMAGIDVSGAAKPDDKAAMLRGEVAAPVVLINQAEQLRNPNAIVTANEISSGFLLNKFASALSGCSAGDAIRFNRSFWEVQTLGNGTWRFHQSTVSSTKNYGGQTEIIFWENECGEMFELAQSVRHLNHAAQNWLRGKPNWAKPGVVISQMNNLPVALYSGEIYDCNACAVIPNDPENLPALWAFCESGEHARAVRGIDQSLKVTPHNLLKVPFDLDHWRRIAAERFPNGLPEPESDDPTQWLFHGRPDYSTAPLQVAVARLLGYRWPAEHDAEMRLSKRARGLVESCESLSSLADEDGIVCIPPVRGEPAAADRLLNLLASAYGNRWTSSTLADLLKISDHAGKSLESWLRDKFFPQHCDMFHHRPFIWHIWDGLPDGFAALVNYHKLDRKNLETLTFTYLGDWISRQRQDIASGVDGAEERLAAAETLKKRLELILEGEAPHDIFVRWKPLHEQPIGWDPDLNDGVRINIRPFISVSDVKKKGAGILRERPKIDWKKDRGKEPQRSKEEYPWFWGWDEKTTDFIGGPEFKGERFNDCHYTIEFKQRARTRQLEMKEGRK
jgi:hypothetical protein